MGNKLKPRFSTRDLFEIGRMIDKYYEGRTMRPEALIMKKFIKRHIPQQKSRSLPISCPMTKRSEARRVWRDQGRRMYRLRKELPLHTDFKKWQKNYCFIFRIIQRVC